MKRLQLCQESHVGAVIFAEESLKHDGSKRRFQDELQKKHKRRKVFHRSISFHVIIGDYSVEEVEATYEKFIANIPNGIYVEGNFVAIDPESADWLTNEDSILRSKMAVELTIRFDGGVYKDTDFAKLKNYAVDDVVIDKEEQADGENQ